MDLHRRHLLGLLGPGLAALAAVADEEAAPASKQRTDDFRDEDLAGAILTIDLAAVQDNWRILDSIAGGAECGAAVKANAYGLGMLPVCSALWKAGCRSFFVARPREGERLRGLLPEATIYVLDGLFAGEPEHFERFTLRPALISPAEARGWAEFCRGRGRRLPCGLHVDTGINRLGFSPREFAELVDDRPTIQGLEISLLMSHLACADEPAQPMNARQLATFREVRGRLPKVPASLANSSGIFLGKDYSLDLVRPGLALYGGNPTPGRPNPMRQVVRLEGVVMQVRDLVPGDVVGYGATWQARQPSRIALLGAGYKDGIPHDSRILPGGSLFRGFCVLGHVPGGLKFELLHPAVGVVEAAVIPAALLERAQVDAARDGVAVTVLDPAARRVDHQRRAVGARGTLPHPHDHVRHFRVRIVTDVKQVARP